ncbi:MAG: GTPase, partial [Dokdonella sp.]
MAQSRLPLRLIVFAAAVLAGAVAVGLLIGTVNSLLEFYQRLAHLPIWLRLPLIVAVALAVSGLTVLAWRIARPNKRTRESRAAATALPTRPLVDERIERLRQRAVETAELESELVELDRRRDSGELYVAVFGEISTGKSSLIRALAPDADIATDVLGGTTRVVAHHHGRLAYGRELVLADIPGSREIDGKLREQLARDEALRAHAVIYLCAADLTASQSAELGWLAGFGKPLILALNKADLYSPQERDALLAQLRQRHTNEVAAIVAISAGGSERFSRTLADGRRESVERERTADVTALTDALDHLTGGGTATLEPAREAAVLTHINQRGANLARAAMAREAEATV